MTPPDTYVFDDFFIALVNQILAQRAEDEDLPITKAVFGVPLHYNRIAHTKMVDGATVIEAWTYTLGRDDWTLTMTNRPSDAEKFQNWKAAGDLEAAHRDLSLLKLAIS